MQFEHVWDSSEGVKSVAMVKLVGKLFNDVGSVYQEFESAFSPDRGDYIGGRIAFDDGRVCTDGSYNDT